MFGNTVKSAFNYFGTRSSDEDKEATQDQPQVSTKNEPSLESKDTKPLKQSIDINRQVIQEAKDEQNELLEEDNDQEISQEVVEEVSVHLSIILIIFN